MRHFHAALTLGALALSPALIRASSPEVMEVALSDDDQCAAGDEACALNAMQLRGRKDAQGAEGNTCANMHTCGQFNRWLPCQCNWKCVQHHNCCPDYVATCVHHRPPPAPKPWTPPPPAPRPAPPQTWHPPPPPAPKPPPPPAVTPAAPTSAPAAGEPEGKWEPQNKILLEPSSAPLYTFYMYRAQSNTSYPLENVNTANLAGVMWYIQNEIVSGKWGSTDRFGVSMIKRYRVQTKATQPLINKNMNFGVRVAFDSGMCTNKACDYSWWLYGFNVGCNNLGSYPFPMFETYYPGAIWYSLPGPCPEKKWNQHNSTCEGSSPGGRCLGTPTGAGDCTYSYEDAGYVTLAELYKSKKTSGQGFWANPNSYEANAKKVQAIAELFDHKYTKMPATYDLKDPKCDFKRKEFFTCDICA